MLCRWIRSLACLGLLATSACESVQAEFDCESICDKLKLCVDDELSVQKCTDQCFDAIKRRESFRDQADECSDCIEDRACRSLPDECSVCTQTLRQFTDKRFGEAASDPDSADAGKD